jgi:arylsulfatase
MLNKYFLYTVLLSIYYAGSIFFPAVPVYSQDTPSYDPSVPRPTLSGISYGEHERQILDFWKAESNSSTPLVFVIHAGGWKGGEKEMVHRFVNVPQLLDAGISVVAINYRLMKHANETGITPPIEAPMNDAARALQFVRSKAGEWNIDKKRIGAAGGSAGACTSLWLAYHDDLADPDSKDLVARESSRLCCAAVKGAQTSLDPKQMKEWTPNSLYGGHAFGKENFEQFLAERESILPWITEYSPYALVSTDDPPVYLFYFSLPALGQNQKDPTHTANFGAKLQERCKKAGIGCELVYPDAPSVKHETTTEYLIATLKGAPVAYGKNTIRRPNILIIHTDQHRVDCIGAYGNKDIKTPNIDNLAKEGMLFKNSYCTLPICTPSRYSLISGMYVHEHKGWTNHCTLNPDIETLPDVLKNAGYKTKAIGKMHYTPTYLDVGFEEMTLAEQHGPGRWDDDYHRDLMKNDLVDRIDMIDQLPEYHENAPEEFLKSFGTAVTNLPDEFYSTNWIAEHAVETIEEWGESGNMLMIGFIKPHHPFDPPKKWAEMYDPDKLELLPGWIKQPISHDTKQNPGYYENIKLDEAALRKTMAYYYASITQIDFEIGRIIKVLKDKGLYDNTIIIYTSDHGEHLGYHHQILKGGYLYESIMKVPLIIKYPGSQYAGTEDIKLVSNIDLAPTILNTAGLKVPESMSGHELTDNSFNREYIYAHGWYGNQAMARSKQYKLIVNRNGESLFFNLETDPLELNNLYNDTNYQDEINSHLEAIKNWQGTDSLFGEKYLDENAPVINQPNVTRYNDGHRDSIIEYFRKKMTEK